MQLNSPLTVEFLPALVDSLVSEKRVQFREILNVHIECALEESYGAFVKVNPIELKRALSNLITNSVEAQGGRPGGQVLITVKNCSSSIILTVRDRGPGIPAHLLQSLGQKGVTFGKEGTQSGSGLGIYHAKKSIEAFGAEFEIISQVGLGTEMRMTFKPAIAPRWFVENLGLMPGQKVVILDDDSGIHSVWNQRFGQFDPQLELIHFSLGAHFCEWFNTKRLTHELNTLALVDYELLGQAKTGLELIEHLGIAKSCVLVTSRFDDNVIQKRCLALGLRLLPKAMANLIPIVRASV